MEGERWPTRGHMATIQCGPLRGGVEGYPYHAPNVDAEILQVERCQDLAGIRWIRHPARHEIDELGEAFRRRDVQIKFLLADHVGTGAGGNSGRGSAERRDGPHFV